MLRSTGTIVLVFGVVVGCGAANDMYSISESTNYVCDNGSSRSPGASCDSADAPQSRCLPHRFGFPDDLARIHTLASLREVRVGAAHACAVGVSGEVYCWGDSSRGQVGRLASTRDCVPRRVRIPFGGARQLDAAGDLTCANGVDSSVWCWGGRSAVVRQSADGAIPVRPTCVSTAGSSEMSVEAGRVCLAERGGLSCWGQMGWVAEFTHERHREVALREARQPIVAVPVGILGACHGALETRSSEDIVCISCDAAIACVATSPRAAWRYPRVGQSVSSERFSMVDARPRMSAWAVLREYICHASGPSIECPGLRSSTSLEVGRISSIATFGDTLCAAGADGTICVRIDRDGWIRESVRYPVASVSVAVGEGAVCVVDSNAALWCGGWAAPAVVEDGLPSTAHGERFESQGLEWAPR